MVVCSVQADCRIPSESLRIGSGFPVVFLQYTSLAIYNNIKKGHASCNIIILPGQFSNIFSMFDLSHLWSFSMYNSCHRLAADSWRMRMSVRMRWHRWHNSNKQTGVLFGSKIPINSETYCVKSID